MNKRNILIIGNSYSVDSHKYVSRIAESLGAYLDVHLLQKGGGKIGELYTHRDDPFFDYRINDIGQTGAKASEPIPEGTGCFTLSEVLDSVRFDTVILQNYWGSSEGVLYYSGSEYETDCSPWYEKMAVYIKEKQPDAEIMINSVWSNEIGFNYTDSVKKAARDAGFVGDEGAARFYYSKITENNLRAAADAARAIGNGGVPLRIIPVGEAIQRARDLADLNGVYKYRTGFRNLAGLPDGTFLPVLPEDEACGRVRLNRDGFHLSLAGRYLAGLVWVETLTGLDVRNCSFVPEPETLRCGVQRVTKTFDIINVNFEPISADVAEDMRRIAHEVCSHGGNVK